jgi:hypothetical protein
MVQLDISIFFREGKLFDFDQNTKEIDIIQKLGNPSEVEEYGENGKYLHYDDLRFLILQGYLHSIDLFFMGNTNEYEIKIDNDIVAINSKISIIKILDILNKLGLKWNIIYESSKLDYLLTEVVSGVKIFYYFENGKIERISKHYL